MLDDLKFIHNRDASDALGIVAKQYEQLLSGPELIGGSGFNKIYNVVYSGMGGSALAAQMLAAGPQLTEPFEIVRGYDLPPYIDGDTLVVLASYSGNTEETLSALEQAQAKGAQIVILTSGGKIWDIAEEKDYLRAKLPKLPEPRYAVLSNYRVLVDVLVRAGVVKGDPVADILAGAELVKKSIVDWLPEIPTSRNSAKKLALECIGKSVVVYGGPRLFPAAYKWKIAFNENAKQVAWCNQLPEFNHNEFVGWSKQPIDKPYTVIDIRGNCEHPGVLKRFEVSARLLSGVRPAPHVVEAVGDDAVQQLLWSLAFGDFVTIYTGLLNNVDPTPVELAAKLKAELA